MFERRLLSLVEAMRHGQDRLVLEVGASEEVPTIDFHMDAGELIATIGEDHYREHVAGREAIVHRAIMLLRNIAGIPHPDLLTQQAEGPCALYSPVLGLAWTGGERPNPDFHIESDRGRLLDIVEGSSPSGSSSSVKTTMTSSCTTWGRSSRFACSRMRPPSRSPPGWRTGSTPDARRPLRWGPSTAATRGRGGSSSAATSTRP